MPPTAPPMMSRVKTKVPTVSKPKRSATGRSTPVNRPVSRSSSSWAKSTKVAHIIPPRPLSRPRMMAMGRSSSWCHSQKKPSFISTFQCTLAAGAAPPLARNWPAMRKMRPAATA